VSRLGGDPPIVVAKAPMPRNEKEASLVGGDERSLGAHDSRARECCKGDSSTLELDD
jgi:hypothetical protein